MESCAICNNQLETDYVCIGDKARRTLVYASLEREDGLHEKLQYQQPLQVHIACRKAYKEDQHHGREEEIQ